MTGMHTHKCAWIIAHIKDMGQGHCALLRSLVTITLSQVSFSLCLPLMSLYFYLCLYSVLSFFAPLFSLSSICLSGFLKKNPLGPDCVYLKFAYRGFSVFTASKESQHDRNYDPPHTTGACLLFLCPTSMHAWNGWRLFSRVFMGSE